MQNEKFGGGKQHLAPKPASGEANPRLWTVQLGSKEEASEEYINKYTRLVKNIPISIQCWCSECEKD